MINRFEQSSQKIDTYLRREFLNAPESLHDTSYILAHVETGAYGMNEVFLADNARVVRFEFFLGGPQSREASLKKIELLLLLLREFREALVIEAAAIERAEQEGE
jgi:hypothetical protein